MSAAVRAKKTEADGIELHGTCRNLSKRMHLVKRILTGMHDVCGKNYPIGIRIDENEFTVRGDTFKQTTGITQELAKEKVAYISLSAERQLHAEKNEYLSKSINKTVFEYKIPIVTTAKTPRAQLAESKLQDFDADIVEICRAILCDPEWPIKSKEGRFNEIRKCSYCNRCMDYPMPRKPTACIR